MYSHRRYKNPPIEEALCEFRFQSSQDWDLTIPGKLHAEFGDEYTGKPRQQKVVEVGLQTQGGKPPNLSYGEGLGRVQLVTEDGKRIVGVGQDTLSIHMLRPYQDTDHPESSGWGEFQPRIENALDAYWRVAKPVSVRWVSIRYINKIVIPQTEIKIGDYLKCAPSDVKDLSSQLSNYFSRMEYTYRDGIRLVLSNGLVQGPLNHVGLLVDFDVIWESTACLQKDEALEKAEELRDHEREAFEAVITNKAREIFDAE